MFVGGLGATVVPLPIRAEAAKPAPADGFTVLEARHGVIRIAPAPAAETAIWGYAGQVPGPLLRVRKGEEVKVRLVNKLDQPTSLTWHGVRIVNAMDGVAGLTQNPVQPGASFDYRFTPPDSGLYWYHPHVWPVSAEQIGRGLYGVLIVDEPEPPEVDGDKLIVIDDWSLDEKGSIKGDFLDTEQALHAGRIGPLVTVNTAPGPLKMEARPGARLRLRLLNACGARIALVTFTGMRPTVIAIDGQPSEIFQPARATIPIGPGSRFETVVDLPPELGKEASLILRGETEPDRTLMMLTTKGEPFSTRPAVAKLPDNLLLPTRIPLEKSLKRDLVIGGGAKVMSARDASVPNNVTDAAKPAPNRGASSTRQATAPQRLWTLGGVASDGFSAKPLFTVRRGHAVTLAFINRTELAQQMHIHGHVMRLLHDLDDGWDPFWRDSVLLAPGKTKHVAFVADNPGKWTIESLILDRQVTGLAAWFDVT